MGIVTKHKRSIYHGLTEHMTKENIFISCQKVKNISKEFQNKFASMEFIFLLKFPSALMQGCLLIHTNILVVD